MKHDLLPVLIHLNYRITPTERRVEVIESDWHLNRRYGRQQPCWIHEQHCRPPLRTRFSARLFSCKIIARLTKIEAGCQNEVRMFTLFSVFPGQMAASAMFDTGAVEKIPARTAFLNPVGAEFS